MLSCRRHVSEGLSRLCDGSQRGVRVVAPGTVETSVGCPMPMLIVLSGQQSIARHGMAWHGAARHGRAPVTGVSHSPGRNRHVMYHPRQQYVHGAIFFESACTASRKERGEGANHDDVRASRIDRVPERRVRAGGLVRCGVPVPEQERACLEDTTEHRRSQLVSIVFLPNRLQWNSHDCSCTGCRSGLVKARGRGPG